MVRIPDTFQEKITNCFGEEGRLWLQTLENTVHTYLEKWQLELIEPVKNLSFNFVLKVREKDGTARILKLGVPNFDVRNEIHTVKLYNGNGCAKIIKEDGAQGVMLLEQLEPGYMLSEEKDENLVLQHYMKVWSQLRVAAPTTESTPSVIHWFEGIKRYSKMYPDGTGPILDEHITLATRYFQEVMETTEGLQLLHGDLHHENILYSNEHGWMAIDPKGVIGDPYFDIASFLINHLHTKPNPRELLKYRIDTISEGLSLNRSRLLKAVIAMTTLYACWGIEDQDPDWIHAYQCVKWFIEFLSE